MIISVIVPIYNVEKYLPKCIESIINQSYTNLEIILVDDCSTDNSGKICNEYASKDNRIVVIHKKNGGVSSARNAGLKIAKGDYIGFVDPDDYIDSNMYEEMYKKISDQNVDLVICGVKTISEEGVVLGDNKLKSTLIITNDLCLRALFTYELGYLRPSVWNKLFKTKLLKSFNEKINISEDFQFNVDYLLRCGNVSILSDSHYFNRKRFGSVTNYGAKINDVVSVAETNYGIYKKIVSKYPYLKPYVLAYIIQDSLGWLSVVRNTISDDKDKKRKYRYMKKIILKHRFSYVSSNLISLRLKARLLLGLI